MTDDLISKSALLADIEESIVFSVKNGQPSAEIRGANKITDRIKAAPAVDAVEVVRCKDCKHAGKHEVIFFPGHIPCGLRMQPTIVKPDDFCSYGERRSDDAD